MSEDPAYAVVEAHRRALLELIDVCGRINVLSDLRRGADDQSLGERYVGRVYELAAELTALGHQARDLECLPSARRAEPWPSAGTTVPAPNFSVRFISLGGLRTCVRLLIP
jgi:hypothetical protein